MPSHSNDPPIHGQSNNVEGAINTSSAASTTVENTRVPDDENTLKKTWLTLLPTEQVIEIVMKLDERVPQNVRKDVWPTDLKAAVFHAAVAKIMESSGKGNAHDVLKSLEASAAQDAKKGTEGSTVGSDATAQAQLTVSASCSPLPTSTASPTPAPLSSSVPSLTPTIPHASPATSTMTYQAASSSYTYTYPYASGSYAYHHPVNRQPYSFYSPSTGSAPYSSAPPPRVPPPPGSIPMPEDDDDLPSYEEMLVQALTVHNDPEGTAPKQLFQWMAATYPLQANFRPSASQALQKAYKRGRFEKSKDGKYRLNARWEGGNTSRRTTRRPQSYSKAVTNPSPSSHPPTNTSQYPPQHYTWTYGGGRTGKSQSQSQSPAPPTPSPAVLPPHPPPPSATSPSELESAPNGIVAQGDTDQESHRSCMEAAYSILQALNVTSAFNSSKVENEAVNASVVVGATPTDTNTGSSLVGKLVVPANIATVSGSVAEHSASPATGVASATSTARGLSQVLDTTVPCTVLDASSSRAALQGSLALLAAQLAELADTSTDSTSEGVLFSLPFWPTPAEASANSASASGFNILEGLDLDVFNSNAWAGLRGVDVDAKL